MTPDEARENNRQVFMEGGARFSSLYRVWVEARRAGQVKLGGLGCMGVGTMWVPEEPRHRDYPGYAEAPQV